MLTFEEWRHTYADVFATDDAARAAWTAASNKGYSAGVQDTREFLAAHSAGAQGANVHTCALCGSTGDCKAKDPRLLNDCQGAWYRPAAHPQPMPQTDAARDAEDAKRYRFIKSQMKVGAVQTQLPLYRTLHWIGYEDCSDVHSADAAIDAEIERLDGAKGE